MVGIGIERIRIEMRGHELIMLRYTDDVIIDQIKILGYTPRGEGGHSLVRYI